MNILGIDFGTKNIGLAWVDTAVGVVLPFGIVSSQELSGLVREEKVDRVVIGLPLGLDGKENANTTRVRKFGEGLKQETGVPVEFYDERFSSQAADAMGEGVSRDEKSAMVILQDYLGKNK